MIPALLVGLVVGWLVGVIATAGVERLARRRSILDVPNERSSHAVPTPRLGGIGIMVGTVAGWAAAGGLEDGTSGLILVVALALGAVGLLDDVGRSSVAGKYLAQLAAAAAVVVIIAPRFNVAFAGVEVTLSGPLAAVVAVVGISAVVNAWNFMDGIDGLMGQVTVVVGFVAVAFIAPAGAGLAVAFAAATAGFLIWNHAPASIFMGDGGSQFLGVITAATLLRGMDASGSGAVAEVVPIGLILAPILFDTGLTLVRRARERRDLFAAHREHLYQRLVQAGAPTRVVASGYAGATALLGLGAVAWADLVSWQQLALVIVALVVAALYVRFVQRLERQASATVDIAGPPAGS